MTSLLAIVDRELVIDGLNVAYWCGSPPQLRLPLALLVALAQRGFRAVSVFDASAAHRFAADQTIHAQFRARWPQQVEVASGRQADVEILRLARDRGARIISRDHFADHRRRFRRLIDDPARRIEGWVEQGRLKLPALGLDELLPETAELAWRALTALDAAGMRADGG
jgi:hypothetical protein